MIDWISDSHRTGGGAHFACGDQGRNEANGYTLESGYGCVTFHFDLGQAGGDLAARREIERIVGLTRLSVGGALIAALATACKHGGTECQLHLMEPDQLTRDLLGPILEQHPRAWSRTSGNRWPHADIKGVAQLRLATGGLLVVGDICRPSTSPDSPAGMTSAVDLGGRDVDELTADELDQLMRQAAQKARVDQAAAGAQLLAQVLDLQPPATAYPLFRYIDPTTIACRGCGHRLDLVDGYREPNHGGCRHWRLFQAMQEEGVTSLPAAHAVCALLGER